MRASAILIDLPCYSVLETGKKKNGEGAEKLLNRRSHTNLHGWQRPSQPLWQPAEAKNR